MAAIGFVDSDDKLTKFIGFLILMIKIFGLYSAVTTIFSALPGNIAFSLRYIDAFIVLWIVVATLIAVGLFWLLIFKADKIIDLLKLDKGFADDRIELGNIKYSRSIESDILGIQR